MTNSDAQTILPNEDAPTRKDGEAIVAKPPGATDASSTSSPSADAHKGVGDYSAWLIEHRDENGKPTWLCNPFFPYFTDNAWEALHFGRRSDAEAFADADGSDYVLYITEHGFPAARAALPAQPSTTKE